MAQANLRRELRWQDGMLLIAGSTIGSGIFLTTGLVAQEMPSPWGILLAWLLGGILAMAGALCCAELAASLPFAGGDYVYLREAYGPLLGFLSGWSSFFVTFSGGIAFLSVAFTQHLSSFWPVLESDSVLFSLALGNLVISISGAKFFSVFLLWTLSAIHYRGLRPGTRIQNLLAAIKVLALALIVLLGFTIGEGRLEHFISPGRSLSSGDWSRIGAAFLPVVFTYAGWNAVIYMAGELDQPQRSLPKALFWANLIIIILYLATNAVYLYGAPVGEIRGVLRVAEVATTNLFGYRTSAWITILIALSILGALHAMIMTGPRIYYAMAKDGLFFRQLAAIHSSYHTPGYAIALQALWSTFLIFTGTFHALLNYVTVIIVAFSAMTVAGLIVLRRKAPDLPRPYKVWGYPWTPSLFVLSHLAIALSTLWVKPVESLLGGGIVLLGVPAYVLWKNRLKGISYV